MTYLLLCSLLILQSSPDAPEVAGQSATAPTEQEALVLDSISIFGKVENIQKSAGSAYVVDETELQAFEYDDPHRVLRHVPGVYLRDEDGYGLRPNIGIRGANSERSSKVTLMEDGILFGPAPYAAPAAYYFPMITRMTAVEVFKGPAAIQYGPQTIGGAINLVTRKVPTRWLGMLDLGIGNYQTGKAHGVLGYGSEHWGLMVEGVRLQTTGFKELDGGGDTGFYKNEVMMKGRALLWRSQASQHTLELKLGYADEVSHETYLGLARQDFKKTPYRRYAASQNDQMQWDRQSVELAYNLQVGKRFAARLVAYRHTLDRTWAKMNGFRGAAFNGVLAHPTMGQEQVYYDVLRGAENATGGDDTLILGTNNRSFYSQGVQLTGSYELVQGWHNQTLRFGARLHSDAIRRRHTADGLVMTHGVLVPDGGLQIFTTRNTGEATALALHALDELRFGESLRVSPGARVELIETRLTDRQNSANNVAAQQAIVLPGVGAYFQATKALGFLAGAHRGFSPLTPGQSDDVKPELSWNYEAGARFSVEHNRLEAIGFFNDYQNLVGECTFSAGCLDDAVTEQFNGGKVFVYGAEVVAAHEQRVLGLDTLVQVNYTLTLSRFRTSFSSDNPQFGDVEEGDALPYVPEHVAVLRLGLAGESFGVDAALTYESAMRDVAGQGDIVAAERIPARMFVDLAAHWFSSDAGEVYVTVNNLLNNAYIASLRPFGVRPGKPFMLLVGYKHIFE